MFTHITLLDVLLHYMKPGHGRVRYMDNDDKTWVSDGIGRVYACRCDKRFYL